MANIETKITITDILAEDWRTFVDFIAQAAPQNGFTIDSEDEGALKIVISRNADMPPPGGQ